MQLASIILYLNIFMWAVITMSVSFYVLLIISYRRATVRADQVDYLLIANSYIALFLSSPFYFDMSLHSIYGQLHPHVSFDGLWCRLKSYAIYVTGSAYFYSFLFQAIYRFCRIVFPTRPALRSFRLYAAISIFQWIFGILQVFPSLFVGYIQYLPHDYHCQLAPTDLRGSLVCLSVIFLIPFIATLVCYVCTIYYVRTRSAALTTLRRSSRVHRDVIILTRLVLVFTFVTTVALPHVLIPIIYAVFGYIPWWTSPFEWLTTIFSLGCVSILQMFITPHLKRLSIRPHRPQVETIRMGNTHM